MFKNSKLIFGLAVVLCTLFAGSLIVMAAPAIDPIPFNVKVVWEDKSLLTGSPMLPTIDPAGPLAPADQKPKLTYVIKTRDLVDGSTVYKTALEGAFEGTTDTATHLMPVARPDGTNQRYILSWLDNGLSPIMHYSLGPNNYYNAANKNPANFADAVEWRAVFTGKQHASSMLYISLDLPEGVAAPKSMPLAKINYPNRKFAAVVGDTNTYTMVDHEYYILTSVGELNLKKHNFRLSNGQLYYGDTGLSNGAFGAGSNLSNYEVMSSRNGRTTYNLKSVTLLGNNFADWTVSPITGNDVVGWSFSLKPAIVTATFDALGGTVDPATTKVVKNEKLGTAPVATPVAGKTFKGWRVKGTEEIVDPTTIALAADTTFEAVYEDLPPLSPISFDKFIVGDKKVSGKAAPNQTLTIVRLDPVTGAILETIEGIVSDASGKFSFPVSAAKKGDTYQVAYSYGPNYKVTAVDAAPIATAPLTNDSITYIDFNKPAPPKAPATGSAGTDNKKTDAASPQAPAAPAQAASPLPATGEKPLLGTGAQVALLLAGAALIALRISRRK